MMSRAFVGGFAAAFMAVALAQDVPVPIDPFSVPGATPTSSASAEVGPLGGKYTNSLTLAPTQEGSAIARIVANLLERSHYSQHPLDDEMSERFFARYLEVLDPHHMYFLADDLEEFSRYRKRLDDLIRPPTARTSNLQPLYNLFNRFLARFDEQYLLAMDLLQRETFAFDGSDEYPVSRREAPYPKNIGEARQLWRDRLRFEYLAEKLNQPSPDKLTAALWTELILAPSKQDPGSPPPFADLSRLDTNRLATNLIASAVGRERALEWYAMASTNLFPDPRGVAIRTPGQQDRIDAPLTTNTPPAFRRWVGAKLDKDRVADIKKTLIRRYNRTLRTLKQYDSDEVLQLCLDALAHAYDPHSDYFGRAATENFSINMSLSLFGIGATLQSEDGYTVIRSIVPGSPAEKSKQIKVNDKIVGVAQGDGEMVDVMDEKLDKVVQQIRGPKGTRVRLNVVPGDSPDPSARRVVVLVRDEIKLEDQEAKARLIELPDAAGRVHRLGVIDLPSFYADFPTGGLRRSQPKSTTRDVAKLITKLKQEKVDGIILDLRRNGGGSLEESVHLAGLFIRQGPIVQVRDASGRIGIDEDTDPSVLYDGPMLVLTSRYSASASEIVAGALQDYGRAVVVGDSSTHGKGTVQTLQELSQFVRAYAGIKITNNPGSTKITIRKFYRASGGSTQLKGVIPDIVLPSVDNHRDVGEGSITNALPWDTIPSASYVKVNAVNAALPELLRRSRERVAKDPDFAYVREDIERFLKQKNEKSVSMNEARRRQEQEEIKQRAEARRKEILARNEKTPTTYEITLKLADQPGLPPPLAKTNIVAVSRADKRALDIAKSGTSARPSTTSASNQEAPKDPPTSSDPPPQVRPLDDDDETKPDDLEGVAADVFLKEAERILADLIALTGNGNGVSSNLLP